MWCKNSFPPNFIEYAHKWDKRWAFSFIFYPLLVFFPFLSFRLSFFSLISSSSSSIFDCILLTLYINCLTLLFSFSVFQPFSWDSQSASLPSLSYLDIWRLISKPGFKQTGFKLSKSKSIRESIGTDNGWNPPLWKAHNLPTGTGLRLARSSPSLSLRGKAMF